MYEPNYFMRLNKVCFQTAEFSCLGEQLIELATFIAPFIPPHVWYAAHLDANYVPEPLFEFGSFELKEVGQISDLLTIAKITDQFLSGVFIAVKEGSQISNTIN